MIFKKVCNSIDLWVLLVQILIKFLRLLQSQPLIAGSQPFGLHGFDNFFVERDHLCGFAGFDKDTGFFSIQNNSFFSLDVQMDSFSPCLYCIIWRLDYRHQVGERYLTSLGPFAHKQVSNICIWFCNTNMSLVGDIFNVTVTFSEYVLQPPKIE